MGILVESYKKTLFRRHIIILFSIATAGYFNFIQNNSKKYKYFLRLDIEKYYPSINHQILLKVLEKILVSRRGSKMLKTRIVEFLNQNKILNKGLPLSNYLSYVLAGIYLLPLDIKIIKTGRPFLRVQDDYLIFCKNKKEPERILKEIVEPELSNLELNIQTRKLYSGKFHQEPLEFLGFRYYGGFLTVSKDKTEEFKKRIILITHLTRNKPKEAVIKQLNNKLLGFGHYYKFGKIKETFQDLDSFIRQGLRRCLLRNTAQKERKKRRKPKRK